MKINQPSIRFPLIDHAHYTAVVERFAEVQPPDQIISGTDIIAGKNIYPAHAAQKGRTRRSIAPRPTASTTGRTRPPCLRFANDSRSNCPDTISFASPISALVLLRLKPRDRRDSGAAVAKSSGLGMACRIASFSDGKPRAAARRLSRRIPTARLNCWQAIPLTRPSHTVGNRGGFRPRNRDASSCRRVCSAASW